jgi:hypothetical protein
MPGNQQGQTQNGTGQNGTAQGNAESQGGPGGTGNDGGGGGGGGGLLNSSTPSDEVQALLNEDADDYTWVAATIGANNAAGYQLAVEHAVMPIGGYNGTDESPTLAQFKALVQKGEIHYYIDSGSGRGGQAGSGSASSDISSWVQENYTATTVDGVTLYDLTADGSAD